MYTDPLEHYLIGIVVWYECSLKADMKSYIPLETVAIFFPAKRYLKQGICSEYVMVDFICMDLLDLWWTRKGKILVHSGIRTLHLPLTKRTR